MTAQTQAQRNASHRARQREKIERYEAALREIAKGDSRHDAFSLASIAENALG